MPKSIIYDLIKRTQIILHFNKILEEEIIKLKLNNPKIKYLDTTTFTYDNNLNRTKNEYFYSKRSS